MTGRPRPSTVVGVHLLPLRLEAELSDSDGSREIRADLEGTGQAFGLGPLEVDLELHDAGLEWSVAVRGDRPVRVRSVSFVYAVAGGRGPVRMLRNGYQSWSPTSVGVVGHDIDPSIRADLPFLQAAHHADQRRARPGELRSEWVTVLADDPGPGSTCVLVGFMGGGHHDGTLRVADGTAPWRSGWRPSWATPRSSRETARPLASRPRGARRDVRRPASAGAVGRPGRSTRRCPDHGARTRWAGAAGTSTSTR